MRRTAPDATIAGFPGPRGERTGAVRGQIRQAIPFRLPFDIPKTSDPLRAWTIETEENPHQLVVGTRQLLSTKVLEIQRT